MYNRLSQVYEALGDPDLAHECGEEEQRMIDRKASYNRDQDVFALLDMAFHLYGSGSREDAEQTFQKAMVI